MIWWTNKCRACSAEIAPKRSKFYCSDACRKTQLSARVAANNEKISRKRDEKRRICYSKCWVCGTPIESIRQKRYCSAACRQRGHRAGIRKFDEEMSIYLKESRQ